LTSQFSALSPEDCVISGSTSKQSFRWLNGAWGPAEPAMVSKWSDTWVPLNTWGVSVQPGRVEDTVIRAALGPTLFALQTALRCTFTPLFDILEPIMCSCSPLSVNSDTQGCFRGALSSVKAGTSQYCKGFPQRGVQFGAIYTELTRASLPEGKYCVNVELDLVPIAQFQLNQAVIASDPFLQLLSSSGNPYAVVRNSFGNYVGQLVTDGAFVNISTVDFSADNRGGGFGRMDEAAAVGPAPMVLCIRPRDVVVSRDEFPLLDFAVSTDLEEFVPMQLASFLVDGRYCAVLNQSGFYFPIALRSNWMEQQSPFVGNESLQIYLFVLDGLYWCVFLFAVVAIIIQFVMAGKELGMQKVLCILVGLFALVRSIYFLLFGLGIINSLADSGNLWVAILLGDLPTYIFFTIYTVLIMFFGNLNIVKKQQGGNFLGKLLVPFVIINLFLYVFFIVVIILGATLTDPNTVDTVNKVYKCIVAGLCFFIVVFFLIFGIQVLVKMKSSVNLRRRSVMRSSTQGTFSGDDSENSTGKKSARRKSLTGSGRRGSWGSGSSGSGSSGKAKLPKSVTTPLIKMSILIAVCSFGLLTQVALLLYLTFATTDLSIIPVIFALYIVIEIIPCVVIVAVLFLPSKEMRAKWKSTVSTASKNNSSKFSSKDDLRSGNSGGSVEMSFVSGGVGSGDDETSTNPDSYNARDKQPYSPAQQYTSTAIPLETDDNMRDTDYL
jgi:hypothetical protein